jgi:phytoene dehydrogenase-like protein
VPASGYRSHGRTTCWRLPRLSAVNEAVRSPLGKSGERIPAADTPFAATSTNISTLRNFGTLPHNVAGEVLVQKRTSPLFAGIAAHSFLPLEAPVSSAFGLVLGLAGHVVGWPIPRGGSRQITSALAAYLRELGGKIEIEHKVDDLNDLPKSRAVILDISVWEFLRIAGQQMPPRYRRRLESFRHAPGIFKIDYALSEPIPWKAEACRHAGTIHLGGTIDEIAAAEGDVSRGKIPERPFVLVAQQSLFDETRAPAGQHTLWVYCHVPFNCNVDMSDRIEAQIERFAPGFRDCILARHKMNASELATSNRSLTGGDINGGAVNLAQLIARPIFSPTPYRTPLEGVYLCSASTPPGGGVHGMCGYHAARAALRDIFGLKPVR